MNVTDTRMPQGREQACSDTRHLIIVAPPLNDTSPLTGSNIHHDTIRRLKAPLPTCCNVDLISFLNVTFFYPLTQLVTAIEMDFNGYSC